MPPGHDARLGTSVLTFNHCTDPGTRDSFRRRPATQVRRLRLHLHIVINKYFTFPDFLFESAEILHQGFFLPSAHFTVGMLSTCLVPLLLLLLNSHWRNIGRKTRIRHWRNTGLDHT